MMDRQQNRDRQGAVASTYLITFACYGHHLPGQPGAVDRHHNLFGARFPEPDAEQEALSRERMEQPAYLLDRDHRTLVLQSLREACSHRVWTILAVHVRTNHVHVVVAADRTAEHVMTALKAAASRR